jgi:hypothetical protein
VNSSQRSHTKEILIICINHRRLRTTLTLSVFLSFPCCITYTSVQSALRSPFIQTQLLTAAACGYIKIRFEEDKDIITALIHSELDLQLCILESLCLSSKSSANCSKLLEVRSSRSSDVNLLHPAFKSALEITKHFSLNRLLFWNNLPKMRWPWSILEILLILFTGSVGLNIKHLYLSWR